MAKIDSEMFGEIIKSCSSDYFFYKEDSGEIIVVFKSDIQVFRPGDEDFVGRIWSPKTMDANGNPLLDNKGNPRQPWDKYEAKATINGIEQILSMGGLKSPLFNNFVRTMKQQGIENDDLPGTKWSINKVGAGYNDWDIQYLGREEIEESPSSSNDNNKKEKIETNVDIDDKVKDAIRAKKDQVSNGISKADLISFLKFITNKSDDEVNSDFNVLMTSGMIYEKDNLIYIR